MLKKVIRNISYVFLSFCMLCANFYVPKVEAKTLGDMKSQLNQFKEDYKNKKLEKNMSEQEKKNIQDKIASINEEILQANEEIINLNHEIEELNQKIEEDEEEIKAILAFTQIQNGESAYLEYAFGAQNFTDFIYRLAISEQLTTYNNELIETNKQNIANNQIKTKELENTKVELAKKQENLKEEMNKIIVTISELNEDMASIDDQIELAESEIAVYEKMGCKLDEDIQDCVRRNQDILPANTQLWRPLQVGYVSGWYGWRIHPIYNYKKFHYGMDISNWGADAGKTQVYSIGSGRVLQTYTNYNTCGGKKIYIQYNIDGVVYTAAYWHLNAVYVKKDELVTKDTVIGQIAGHPDPVYGTTDTCSNGGHVHLEISTGNWFGNDYYAKSFAANTIINFPRSTYKQWTNRNQKF